MFFALIEYRILGKISMFMYNMAKTYTDEHYIYLSELKLFGIRPKKIFKYCVRLRNLGFIDMNYQKDNINEHVISLTEKGKEYYHSLRINAASTIFICFWNVVMLLSGFILGKVF